jgi:transposase
VIQIDLSKEEKEVLQQYFKTSPISLIRLKAQAILLRDHEMKVEEIAYAVVRDERTIERWITDFSKKRLGSIFSGMVENEHASKLTKEQKEEIKKVLSQKPSVYGLPKEF